MSYHLSAIFINATSFLLYCDIWIGSIASRKMRTKSSFEKERLKNVLSSLNLLFHPCSLFFNSDKWIGG